MHFPTLRNVILTTFIFAISCVALMFSQRDSQASGVCNFNSEALTFAGSPVDQARCLLRSVRRYAHLGPILSQLPNSLQDRVGRPVDVSVEDLRAYVNHHGFTETQIGGNLDDPISRANNNQSSAPLARYFIIHDTSTPYFGNDPFPGNLDTDRRVNNLDYYRDSTGNAKAHVFVNRGGEVYNGHDFGVPWRATKLEINEVGVPAKGLFLHIEIVQPRRRDPQGGQSNDALAPDPGFSQAQYDWLALFYVAASVRKGEWLIPAYHAVLDNHLPDGHDDPQKFDIEMWSGRLGDLVSDIGQFDPTEAGANVSENAKHSLKVTKYYVALHSDYVSGNSSAFRAPDGSILARVSPEFLRGAEIEGSAKLQDGRILNYHSKVNDEIRWQFVSEPYGIGANRCPLDPLRSVAVDRNVIPLNSRLLISETVGLTLPDGTIHDGIWYAVDVGGGINGDRVDLFTGIGKISMKVIDNHGIDHLQPLTVKVLDHHSSCP